MRVKIGEVESFAFVNQASKMVNHDQCLICIVYSSFLTTPVKFEAKNTLRLDDTSKNVVNRGCQCFVIYAILWVSVNPFHIFRTETALKAVN